MHDLMMGHRTHVTTIIILSEKCLVSVAIGRFKGLLGLSKHTTDTILLYFLKRWKGRRLEFCKLVLLLMLYLYVNFSSCALNTHVVMWGQTLKFIL